MKDKQLYPRPAMPTKAESFMFRPSSPIRTPSTPSTRSFFSRLPKPSKPSPESTLIPWESTYPATPESASSMSRSLFATSPQSPPILDIVRPTSPASTYSRESTTSSSRWSNKWGRGKASSTTRQHDYNRGYNESWDSHPSQSWQSSDWPQEEEEQMHLRSPSKPEAKREKVKHVFGLKKKGSNFSLRSFVKAVGRDSRSRTSADYGSTPPESPVSSFTPSLHRQRSSPEISRHFARSASSSPLPSPILPLSFSTMVRERTVSSPLGIIEEQGSVKGKAARILGEAIVPQGKAARFLGVERKPTLKQKPSMSSLADSMRSGGTQKTVSESTDTFDSPPPFLRPLPSAHSERLSPSSVPEPIPQPYSLSQPIQLKKHQRNESASDPFWHTDRKLGLALDVGSVMAEAPRAGISERDAASKAAKETLESTPSWTYMSECRPSISPVQEELDLDPTDSVYIGSSTHAASLRSISVDFAHLSTFGSSRSFSTNHDGSHPVSERLRGSPFDADSRISLSFTRSSLSSSDDQHKPSRKLTSQSPTSLSRTHSRLSQRKSAHASVISRPSTGSSLVSLPPGTLTIPLPLNDVSRTSSSSSRQDGSLCEVTAVCAPPSVPLPIPIRSPVCPLPPIPHLDGFPPFLESAPNSLPSNMVMPRPKPLRNNTAESTASVDRKTWQHSNALQALEGRWARSPAVTESETFQDGRGSRRRAARDRSFDQLQDMDHILVGEGQEEVLTEMNEFTNEKNGRNSDSFLSLSEEDEDCQPPACRQDAKPITFSDDQLQDRNQRHKSKREPVAVPCSTRLLPPLAPLVSSPDAPVAADLVEVATSCTSEDSGSDPSASRMRPYATVPNRPRSESLSSTLSRGSQLSISSMLPTSPADITASSFPQPPVTIISRLDLAQPL